MIATQTAPTRLPEPKEMPTQTRRSCTKVCVLTGVAPYMVKYNRFKLSMLLFFSATLVV